MNIKIKTETKLITNKPMECLQLSNIWSVPILLSDILAKRIVVIHVKINDKTEVRTYTELYIY
jgi:hypothetical protein